MITALAAGIVFVLVEMVRLVITILFAVSVCTCEKTYLLHKRMDAIQICFFISNDFEI
jgi:hypothetical protein